MGIKEKDIKILWGRAANRCSFPDCHIKLAQDKKATPESFPLGEQAHIVGKEPGSVRSKSPLTEEDRDSYHNLILLCPTHHTLIDKNPEDFPIERLHMIKSDHEYWVESTLSEKTDQREEAEVVFYANIVDLAVEKCHFNDWDNWVSLVVEPSHALRYDIYKDGIEFSLATHKAIWPKKLIDLENSIIYLGSIINLLLNFYLDNAETRPDNSEILRGIRFYKMREFEPTENQKRAALFDGWEKLLYELTVETTKCANLTADLVRKHLNPLFFLTQGKFSLVSLSGDLQIMHSVFEFSEEDMSDLLLSYDKRIGKWRDRVSTFKKECPYI